MLNTLNGYLGGQDNVKKVLNSGCLDHRGKMLSYDGSKIFTAGKSRNNRFNRRGRGNRGGRNDNRSGRNGDNQDGKPKGKGNGKSSSVSTILMLSYNL